MQDLQVKFFELLQQGRLSEAADAAQQVLDAVQGIYGPDHPEVALALNNLAEVFRHQGKNVAAEPLLRRALPMMEKAHGPDHSSVATVLNSLGELYLSKGMHGEAEPFLKRALEIDEKVHGKDHPEIADALDSLGQLYLAQERYAETEALCKRSLAVREKALKSDNPNLATSLYNLAQLYHRQKNYVEAEPLYRQALAIWEDALGNEHPTVGTCLNDLGLLFDAERKYTEAEPLHKRALVIAEKALGPEHPEVATRLSNLGGHYYSQGKYAQAELLFERVLTIDEKIYGKGHPDVARRLKSLAKVYQEQRKYAEAEPLRARALAIDVATLEESITDASRKGENTDESQEFMERADLSTCTGDAETSDAQKVNEAEAHLVKGDIQTARRLLEEVVANTPKQYVHQYEEGDTLVVKFWDRKEFLHYVSWMREYGNPRYVGWKESAYPRAYYYLGFISVKETQYAAAIELLDAGHRLEPTNPRFNLEKAVAYTYLGDYQKVLSLYDQVREIGPHVSGIDKAQALRGKGFVLIKMGELDSAEAVLKKSLEYEPDNATAANELAVIEKLRASANLGPIRLVKRGSEVG